MHVGFLDHRGQRLLGHSPRSRKPGSSCLCEASGPQLDGSRAGLPVTVAEAIALVDRSDCAPPSSRRRRDPLTSFHQALGSEADHLAKKIGVGESVSKSVRRVIISSVIAGSSVRVLGSATKPYR